MQTERIIQMMPGAGTWTLSTGKYGDTLMPVTMWLLVRCEASDSDGWEEIRAMQPGGEGVFWGDVADTRWDTVIHAPHDDPERAMALADDYLRSRRKACGRCDWRSEGWAYEMSHDNCKRRSS